MKEIIKYVGGEAGYTGIVNFDSETKQNISGPRQAPGLFSQYLIFYKLKKAQKTWI